MMGCILVQAMSQKSLDCSEVILMFGSTTEMWGVAVSERVDEVGGSQTHPTNQPTNQPTTTNNNNCERLTVSDCQ